MTQSPVHFGIDRLLSEPDLRAPLKGKRVETQVLYFDGWWQGYTYRWNAKGSEASLVGAGGVALPDECASVV